MKVPKQLKRNWRLFVTREATMLERGLRLLGYHGAGVAHVLFSSPKGVSSVYVDGNEWQKLEKKSKDLIESGAVHGIFRDYKKRLVGYTKLLGTFSKRMTYTAASIEKLFEGYGSLATIIIKMHQFEKEMDTRLLRAAQKLGEGDAYRVATLLAAPTIKVPGVTVFSPKAAIINQQEKILSKYPSLKKISIIARWVSYFHEVSRRLVDDGNKVFEKNIAPEIAKFLGVEPDLIRWYLPSEIIAALRNKVKLNPWMARSRKQFYLLYSENGRIQVWSGPTARDLSNRLLATSAGKVEAEIRGTPASTGVARGIVKLAYRPTDLKNISRDTVIVSPMTEPRMTPYLSRIQAIVTDEGGLTSHAAVVSREFGIPCIVGTGTATKVFKDGDRVEVDASKGVVRKL